MREWYIITKAKWIDIVFAHLMICICIFDRLNGLKIWFLYAIPLLTSRTLHKRWDGEITLTLLISQTNSTESIFGTPWYHLWLRIQATVLDYITWSHRCAFVRSRRDWGDFRYASSFSVLLFDLAHLILWILKSIVVALLQSSFYIEGTSLFTRSLWIYFSYQESQN